MTHAMQYRPTGLAFFPNTTVMVEGAPAGLNFAATYGGRTVPGRYVPADPASQTHAPSRYIVDVSSFASPGSEPHPIVTVTLSDATSVWTWVGTPANGAGFIVPFASFAKSVPWTTTEKAAAVAAGVAVVGGIVWWWKRRNP